MSQSTQQLSQKSSSQFSTNQIADTPEQVAAAAATTVLSKWNSDASDLIASTFLVLYPERGRDALHDRALFNLSTQQLAMLSVRLQFACFPSGIEPIDFSTSQRQLDLFLPGVPS